MAGESFDTLTRRVTSLRSRRHALTVGAGGVIATTLAGLGRREADAADAGAAAARCRKATERCRRTRQCCGQTLSCAVTSTTYPTSTVCCKPAGARCTRDAECCGVGSFCFPGGYCQD